MSQERSGLLRWAIGGRTDMETSHVATQLDEDHAPETNGRMSVCRRCGSRTDSPEGLHHKPLEQQLARSTKWLLGQELQRRIDRVRARQNN